MPRPPPPPSATHSSFGCPNSSPADNSTAADAEAVAGEGSGEQALKKSDKVSGREADDEGLGTTGPGVETLARRQASLKIKTAWLSSRTANKDKMSVVMDFAQNMDVPDLKEQPGSTYWYYYPPSHGKCCHDILASSWKKS